MDEDEPEPNPSRKPSAVPSWVTLGFGLGALFVLALPRHAEVEHDPGPVIEAPVTRPVRPPEAPRITTIEAVFAAWDKYAVWSNDTTEVALWNSETQSYSDCYEVLRTGNGYFFRSITSLTRPILTHGVVDESPLQFTETARQRAEWLGEVRKENLKALSDSITRPAPTPTAEPPIR